MNVTIVSAIDPYTTKPGGTRPYVLNILKALSTKEINFSLWGISYNERNNTKLDFEFVPLVRNNERISNYQFIGAILYKILFEGIPKDHIIHAQRADVLFPFILLGTKNPTIVTIHGHNLDSTLIYKKGVIIGNVLKIIYRFVINRVDKVIAVDEKTKEFYTQKFPKVANKVEVIPVSVDTTIFKPMDKNLLRKKYNFNKDDKIVMFIGRHNKEKRIELLIDAIELVKKEIPNCKLVLIGNGPEKNSLMSRTEGLDYIIYLDTIEHSLIPELLNCADIFALCSAFEGMPNVILESLACGVPVVSTDVGDLKKVVVDGQNGFIVRRATVDEVSEYLTKLLNKNKITKEQCIQSVVKYSHEQIGEDIREVYYEVLHKN